MNDDRAKAEEGSTVGREARGDAAQRLEARCRVLREALDDVEVDNRQLRAQLAALTAAYEGLTGGAQHGPAAIETLSVPQPLSAKARLKRLARGLIRATVGTARRLWQAGDPGQRYVVAVRPTGAPASALPTISVVVSTAAGTQPVEPKRILKGETAEGIELASWNRETGDLVVWPADGTETIRCSALSRDDLLAALEGEWLMMVPSSSPQLPATVIEDLRWLVATESLQYIRVPVRPRDIGHFNPGASELLLCARAVFDPVRLIDLDRLARSARSHPVVGKTVRLAGPLDAAAPRPVAFAGEGRGLVVAVGRYELWGRNRSGPVEHSVAAVPGGVIPAGKADDRPAVVMVVAQPLDGGVDRLVGKILQQLGDEIRFQVVTTGTDNALGLARAAELEKTGVSVHELGSVLDPSAWPSAVVRVAERCAASCVLLVGWDKRLAPAAGELRQRGLRLVATAVEDGGEGILAEHVVSPQADTVGGEEARKAADPSVQAIRSELGVAPHQRLVLTLGDLVPRCRPEDVVLVADRLRDEDGLCFLVVGEGPLAGQVADLAVYLDLPNVLVRPPGHPIADLVAAADVVLDPAESAPARPAVLEALVTGRPVVATLGGGLADILGPAGVNPEGGPEALARALIQVLRGEAATGDPEVAREAIGRLARERIEVLRRALLEGGSKERSG